MVSCAQLPDRAVTVCLIGKVGGASICPGCLSGPTAALPECDCHPVTPALLNPSYVFHLRPLSLGLTLLDPCLYRVQ